MKIKEIPEKIKNKYQIKESEKTNTFHLKTEKTFLSLPDNSEVTEYENTFHIETNTCVVTLWKNEIHVHITIF